MEYQGSIVVEDAAVPHTPKDTAPPLPIPTVLSAKLAPPSLQPGQLDRRSLLATWRTHRLTVVSAPAGYGKSTLAVQATQGVEPGELNAFHVAWLTLDAQDNEPAQFVACLTAALAALLPASTAVAAAAINQHRVQAALHHLLVGLEQAPAPVLMVLDDFHHIRDPAVQQLAATAIERSQAACRWMVLTRHAPPARLIGKLRVQGQLLEVNADELRLSHAEIGVLAAQFGAFQLDADAIALLAQRTQGWLAGIHLALLSLQRHAGGPRRTVREVLGHLQGGNRLLAEYLTAEVLAQLSEPLRAFLLRCAILDRLNPDICGALTGQESSALLLEQALSEQLFIRALDAEGEWYELHHLFRELLQRQLRLQLAPAQLQALYRRAADWYLTHGDIAQALHYLIAGGAPELAAALLVNHARPALLSNRQAELRHWLNLLPATVLDAYPQLLLDHLWLSLSSATDQFAAALPRAAAVIATHPAAPAAWRDEVAVLRLWQRMLSSNQTGVYADALEMAASLAPESALARGWCWLATLLTRSAHPAGAPVAAYAQAAAAAFTDARCDLGSLLVTGWQAEYYAARGDAATALATCARAHQIILSQQYPALSEREYFDFLAGEIHYWLDRPQAATVYFQRALNDARTRSDALPILRASASLQMCEATLSRAVALTDEACAEESALWQRDGQTCALGFRSQVVLWQIQRWLKVGRPLDAWGAYQQLGVTPETASADAPEALWLAILLANVALGRELTTLTPHLERLLRQSERGMLPLTAIRVRLLWAHQQQQLGFHNRARTILRPALHDIERTGYVRLLLDYPAILPTLRAADTQFAKSMCTRIDAPAPSSIGSTLTTQELTILGHLVDGAKIAEIAEALVISPGTVKWHLTNLYTKLSVKNQREAVSLALRHQLLPR